MATVVMDGSHACRHAAASKSHAPDRAQVGSQMAGAGTTGMGKVIYDVSMSLDGFIAASGMTADEGLGSGGEVLHDWYMAEEKIRDRPIAEYYDFGAFIAGRRTYDNSIKWWGAAGHSAGPTIIVSHGMPAHVPGQDTYIFVDSLAAALDTARNAAGDKDIRVMGGDIAGQFLREGLVDEIAIHLSPVLFGAGLPLFGEGPLQLGGHVRLEQIEATSTKAATHLFYRVTK